MLEESPDVWLATETLTKDMWLKKLQTIPNIDDMVQTSNVDINGGNNNTCLSLSINPDRSPPFAVKPLDCNEKRKAICILKNPNPSSSPKPPRFPCITPNLISRKKRSNSEHDEGKHFFGLYAKLYEVF